MELGNGFLGRHPWATDRNDKKDKGLEKDFRFLNAKAETGKTPIVKSW